MPGGWDVEVIAKDAKVLPEKVISGKKVILVGM